MVRDIPETDLTCENTSSWAKLLDRLEVDHAADRIAAHRIAKGSALTKDPGPRQTTGCKTFTSP
jgi:hypothetical protein